MTKKELVAAVSEKHGLTKKDSEAALSAVLDAISESLSSRTADSAASESFFVNPVFSDTAATSSFLVIVISSY